jgi:hypothetical protein
MTENSENNVVTKNYREIDILYGKKIRKFIHYNFQTIDKIIYYFAPLVSNLFSKIKKIFNFKDF